MKTKPRRPGTVAANKIPIYARGPEGELQQRGHIGAKATSVAVSRFIGKHGAKLEKVKGRTAWVGPAAPMPRKPETKDHAAARGSVSRNSWTYPK